MGEITENAPDDLEGLDASAAHIASLLSAEPPDGMCFFYQFAVFVWYSHMPIIFFHTQSAVFLLVFHD